MYNFHKTKHDSSWREFQHPYFKRGRPDLLPFIRRKTNQSAPALSSAAAEVDNRPAPEDNTTFRDDQDFLATPPSVGTVTSSRSSTSSEQRRSSGSKRPLGHTGNWTSPSDNYILSSRNKRSKTTNNQSYTGTGATSERSFGESGYGSMDDTGFPPFDGNEYQLSENDDEDTDDAAKMEKIVRLQKEMEIMRQKQNVGDRKLHCVYG